MKNEKNQGYVYFLADWATHRYIEINRCSDEEIILIPNDHPFLVSGKSPDRVSASHKDSRLFTSALPDNLDIFCKLQEWTLHEDGTIDPFKGKICEYARFVSFINDKRERICIPACNAQYFKVPADWRDYSENPLAVAIEVFDLLIGQDKERGRSLRSMCDMMGWTFDVGTGLISTR